MRAEQQKLFQAKEAIQELGQEEENHHQWLGVHWLELGLLGRVVRAEREVECRGQVLSSCNCHLVYKYRLSQASF